MIGKGTGLSFALHQRDVLTFPFLDMPCRSRGRWVASDSCLSSNYCCARDCHLSCSHPRVSLSNVPCCNHVLRSAQFASLSPTEHFSQHSSCSDGWVGPLHCPGYVIPEGRHDRIKQSSPCLGNVPSQLDWCMLAHQLWVRGEGGQPVWWLIKGPSAPAACWYLPVRGGGGWGGHMEIQVTSSMDLAALCKWNRKHLGSEETTRMIWGLEHLYFWDRLRELRFFSLEKKKLWGRPYSSLSVSNRAYMKAGEGLFVREYSDRTRCYGFN